MDMFRLRALSVLATLFLMNGRQVKMDEKVLIAENVTISKKLYDRLLRDSRFLGALEAFGVDNWDGYSDAYRSVSGDSEEIDPEDETYEDIYGEPDPNV